MAFFLALVYDVLIRIKTSTANGANNRTAINVLKGINSRQNRFAH